MTSTTLQVRILRKLAWQAV